MPKKNAQPSVSRSPEFSERSAPVSRNRPTVATATASEHVGGGRRLQHDGLDERREHDEQAGDERRVRRRRALEPRVLEPVAERTRRHRTTTHARTYERGVARRHPADANPRASANGSEHERADREPQQDEADRRDAFERVLHEHERRSVRGGRGEERELGQQRPPRLPRRRSPTRTVSRASGS